jgi:glutaminase
MCKPFAFQMALEQHGPEKTLRHVGVEPSGEAFNSIEFDQKTGRPYNPMVNAGAIAVASLIKRKPVEAGIDAFVEQMGKAAGRKLRIDESVLASETLTGNRNRAIAYMLLNSGIIDDGVQESLHQYFAQCSMLVNCKDLAMMAATMANIGNHPVTGERVFDFQLIKYVMAVMFSCGLYDYAGNWAFEVGVPAAWRWSVFAQAGCSRQQRARNSGLQGTGEPSGDACVRLQQRRIQLHAVAAVEVLSSF